MNNKRLTSLAMLIAIYCVLSIITPIRIVNFKFTFEAFPIYVASLLLGPVDGLIVGGVGSFIYQILFSGYGITATTILWVIPHALSGYVAGLYAKSKNFSLDFKQYCFIVAISNLIVTILNTFALFIDSKLFGYYSYVIVFGSLFAKIIVGIILAIIYSFALPQLIRILKRQTMK